jgi:hypothetical protein
MDKFLQVMQEDLEKMNAKQQEILKEAFMKLIKIKPEIQIHSTKLPFLNILKKTNRIFMYRPHQYDTKLPHIVDGTFSIFVESSEDLFSNYMRTIKNITGEEPIRKDDKERFMSMIGNGNGNGDLNILCWSNSNILLSDVMKNHGNLFINANVINFGGPILLKKGPCQNCLNIYHQDDWILGLLKIIYDFDFSNVKKNVIHKTKTNEEFIILSRRIFTSSSTKDHPHRCYDIFL